MVLDVQGKGYCLCNPEIGSADLRDANGDTFLLVLGTCLSLPLKNSKNCKAVINNVLSSHLIKGNNKTLFIDLKKIDYLQIQEYEY